MKDWECTSQDEFWGHVLTFHLTKKLKGPRPAQLPGQGVFGWWVLVVLKSYTSSPAIRAPIVWKKSRMSKFTFHIVPTPFYLPFECELIGVLETSVTT